MSTAPERLLCPIRRRPDSRSSWRPIAPLSARRAIGLARTIAQGTWVWFPDTSPITNAEPSERLRCDRPWLPLRPGRAREQQPARLCPSVGDKREVSRAGSVHLLGARLHGIEQTRVRGAQLAEGARVPMWSPASAEPRGAFARCRSMQRFGWRGRGLWFPIWMRKHGCFAAGGSKLHRPRSGGLAVFGARLSLSGRVVRSNSCRARAF